MGLGNIFLTEVLGLSSIIATLATYSILKGVALWLRPTPDGSISLDFADFMLTSIGGRCRSGSSWSRPPRSWVICGSTGPAAAS